MITKRKKSPFAMPAAATAIPQNPNRAATSAITRQTTANRAWHLLPNRGTSQPSSPDGHLGASVVGLRGSVNENGATGTRASKSWGSSRQGLFFQRHIRIPALEHRSERLLQGVHPRVPQAMGAARGPLPRRLFADAPAADLGDRGFDTTRAHPLPIARARAVVGDAGALPLAIG